MDWCSAKIKGVTNLDFPNPKTMLLELGVSGFMQ